jgi:hypothetical protein
VEKLLAERGTSLEELVRAGRLEHALFMMWASVKNILYRGMVPGAELEFLDRFLADRKISADKLETDSKITLSYGELRELIKTSRKWAWSLRQSVIPIRGRALEKIVRLVVGDALAVFFEKLPGVHVSSRDTSGDRNYHNIDYTVFMSAGSLEKPRRFVLGFNIRGNIRERKDESVDTRRRAISARTHDQVWHIFLSEGDEGDMTAFRQMNPEEDGQVYTWTGIAEKLGMTGVKPISQLPSDIASFVKQRS